MRELRRRVDQTGSSKRRDRCQNDRAAEAQTGLRRSRASAVAVVLARAPPRARQGSRSQQERQPDKTRSQTEPADESTRSDTTHVMLANTLTLCKPPAVT